MKKFMLQLLVFAISAFYFWCHPIYDLALLIITMGIIIAECIWDTIDLNREEFKEWFNIEKSNN